MAGFDGIIDEKNKKIKELKSKVRFINDQVVKERAEVRSTIVEELKYDNFIKAAGIGSKYDKEINHLKGTGK
jgi:hypothetical protein